MKSYIIILAAVLAAGCTKETTNNHYIDNPNGQQQGQGNGGNVIAGDGVINGAFTVTAGGMYYASTTPDVRIEFFDFVRRKSTVVARNLGAGAEVGGFMASADARTLLYARRQSAVDDLMLVERFR